MRTNALRKEPTAEVEEYKYIARPRTNWRSYICWFAFPVNPLNVSAAGDGCHKLVWCTNETDRNARSGSKKVQSLPLYSWVLATGSGKQTPRI